MSDTDYRFTVRPLSEEEGGGYLVEFPDLPGCMSDGETVEEAIANGEDAKRCWIAAMKEAGRPIPPPSVEPAEGYSGKWQLRAPKSLHRRLAERAKREGVSLNTLAVTLLAEGLGERVPRMATDRRLADQPPVIRAISSEALSLPQPVLVKLSLPWIAPARFSTVMEAFGPLPIDGQTELADRLIGARGQYLSHRMSESDKAARQGVRRTRLGEIGAFADRLLRLLHRDRADPQPWNLHPAITLALPQLVRISSEHRPSQIWDQGLSRFAAMLVDLAEAGAQADAAFDTRLPRTRGGSRREGRTPASGLVDRLIEVYVDLRTRFPESGPPPAFGNPLLQFVRAGLAFAVGTRTIYLDDKCLQPLEAAYMEADLPKPTRLTDDAIRAIWARRHSQIKVK
jgi:antitoxin HicB